MYPLKIISTGDGSNSIYVPELNETYHSVHGALTESKHVFIKNGFRYILSNQNPESLNILEVGLGTGLNVLLTILENMKFHYRIAYTAIEAFPAPPEIISKLNFVREIGGNDTQWIFDLIHSCQWEEFNEITDRFFLKKIKIRFQDSIPVSNLFHLVYYDAFAPNKQPEMWEPEILQKIYSCLIQSGIMVTYTAKGQLKRDLKTIGFNIETLQGPPGKKEMIRAIKPSSAQ